MSRTIPAAVVSALREPQITAADFADARFFKAADKAWFVEHMLRFVSADFPRHHLTARFHKQMMFVYRFTPHYDRAGFHREYLSSGAGKAEFLRMLLDHTRPGHPSEGFADATAEIARRIRTAGLPALYARKSRDEEEAEAYAAFVALKARFEPDADAPAPPPCAGCRARAGARARQQSLALA